jgi:hypothetical protein
MPLFVLILLCITAPTAAALWGMDAVEGKLIASTTAALWRCGDDATGYAAPRSHPVGHVR